MALQTPAPQLPALATPPPAVPPAHAAPPPAPVTDFPDVAPPADILPYPMWMVVTAAVLIAILLGVVLWLIIRAIRRRPAPPPPSPRTVALRALEALRPQVERIAPYEFSIEVSDVLRSYVEAQYGLRAKEQTSPEFLGSLAAAPQFTDNDRDLLARFLEKCDLIKFAHIDASSADSDHLLGSALAFVQGGRA